MQVQDSYYACQMWDTNQHAGSGYLCLHNAHQLLSPSCLWFDVNLWMLVGISLEPEEMVDDTE